MLFTFTNREVSVLKKILPTVKLTAYDIQTYQNILHSLDNPYNKPSPRKQLDNSYNKTPKKQFNKLSTKVIIDNPIDYSIEEVVPESKPETNKVIPDRVVSKSEPEPKHIETSVIPSESMF
ncbi:MAG: hypothetical protein J7L15_01820 [Clostridiales bacterium]|nr:hypothetical protein [Clostridiales bacterium]